MRMLMVSTDQKIFEPESEVKQRMLGYAESLDELFIVVLGVGRLLQVEGKLTYLGLTRWQAWWWRPPASFDLVTAQDPFETGLIGWRLAGKIKMPLELQIHTDFLNPYFAKQSVLNRLRVRITKHLLPRANKIRVVSQRIADSLKANHYKLKTVPEIRPVLVLVEKLRSAPIVTDLHQKYPQFKKILLMASRLTWEKNIALALTAMGKVIKQIPSIGLVIVGSGPEEKKLKNLTRKYALESNVIFEPWTNDLASYYKTADVFLNTSYYEGYGRTIVEAQACGLPVISTDVGVARETGAIIVDQDTLVEILIQQISQS